MKFKANDLLFYVNPFVFNIEKVKIDMAVQEDDGTIYYIDSSGAYLNECDLFYGFTDAQHNALKKLDKFVYECRYQILNNKPHYGLDD